MTSNSPVEFQQTGPATLYGTRSVFATKNSSKYFRGQDFDSESAEKVLRLQPSTMSRAVVKVRGGPPCFDFGPTC